jgi:ubiquinone/menaquinone biosynthesis C-methylase UbiE
LRMPNLQKQIKDEFSSKHTQKLYREKAFAGLWKSEETLIRKYFPKKCNVLDLGCGTGRTTFPLVKMGYKVTAIDFVPAMITTAKKVAKEKKIKVNFQVGDAIKLKFKDSSFDAVLFSFNGWEQIPGKGNRIKALEESYRVLRKEGILIFSTHRRSPSLKWLGRWLDFHTRKLVGKQKLADYGDIMFTREGTKSQRQFIHIAKVSEVKRLVKAAGFKFELVTQDLEGNTHEEVFYVCRK